MFPFPQAMEAETDAAQCRDEFKQKEREMEQEMEEHRNAAELMRVSQSNLHIDESDSFNS